jgi:hypothetical protein
MFLTLIFLYATSFRVVSALPAGKPAAASSTPCPSHATRTVTVTPSALVGAAVSIPTIVPTPAVISSSETSVLDANPTSTIAVSRAGVVLNPSAAAEANVRDDAAVRAFSSVSLQSSGGDCPFIDPTAGDFRENLIPVQLKACDGSPNTKFDIITQGKHNNVAGQALIVSSLVS